MESTLRFGAVGLASLCGIILIISTFLAWITIGGSFMGVSVGFNITGLDLITGTMSLGDMEMDMNMEDMNLEDLEDLEDLDLEDLDLEDLDLEDIPDMDMDDLQLDDFNLRIEQDESGLLASRSGPVAQQTDDFDGFMEDEKIPGNFLFRTDGTFQFTGFWTLLFGAALIAAAVLVFVTRKEAWGYVAAAIGGAGFLMALVNVIMVYTKMQPEGEYASYANTGAGMGLWLFLIFSLLAVGAGVMAVIAERRSWVEVVRRRDIERARRIPGAEEHAPEIRAGTVCPAQACEVARSKAGRARIVGPDGSIHISLEERELFLRVSAPGWFPAGIGERAAPE